MVSSCESGFELWDEVSIEAFFKKQYFLVLWFRVVNLDLSCEMKSVEVFFFKKKTIFFSFVVSSCESGFELWDEVSIEALKKKKNNIF